MMLPSMERIIKTYEAYLCRDGSKIVTFGPHKGKRLAQVPNEYLKATAARWIVETEDWCNEIDRRQQAGRMERNKPQRNRVEAADPTSGEEEDQPPWGGDVAGVAGVSADLN